MVARVGNALKSAVARSNVSVLIPTYRRPLDLQRCINALLQQTVRPFEIIVVARPDDFDTWTYLGTVTPSEFVTPVEVREPGLMQALQAGLEQVQGEIVAITDDDAAPASDWVSRISAAFGADDQIAGVGGRDIVHHGTAIEVGNERRVGIVPKLGRMIGNHHVGVGPVREVDVLKGVNGAYRTALLREIGFDQRLRGTGAQVHWEVGVGIQLRRRGLKLRYDPEILVDHFVAPRFDEDQRNSFSPLATSNAAYNEGLLRMEYLSISHRFLYLFWAILIGTRATPGLIQVLRLSVGPSRKIIGPKFVASVRGILESWLYLQTK